MNVLARIIWGSLLAIVESLVGRVLLAIGFGFVEFVGLQAMISGATDYAATSLDLLQNSVLLEWAGFFRLDVHVSIIISAIGAKMLLNALTGDRIRRLVPKSGN